MLCFPTLTVFKIALHIIGYRGSVGLITVSMPASAEVKHWQRIPCFCIKTSKRLVALCKRLVEIDTGEELGVPSQPMDVGSWTFDSQKLLPADLSEVQMCYEHPIKFVNRAAYDFFFGNENEHTDNAL
jgi:hypothetical protein